MRWWQIGKRNADLERELRADLEIEEEEQRKRGVPPEEAAYAPRRAFGNIALIREQTHEAWGLAPVERFWQDLLHALRSVRRAPLLSCMAILALAFGIGRAIDHMTAPIRTSTSSCGGLWARIFEPVSPVEINGKAIAVRMRSLPLRTKMVVPDAVSI